MGYVMLSSAEGLPQHDMPFILVVALDKFFPLHEEGSDGCDALQS